MRCDVMDLRRRALPCPGPIPSSRAWPCTGDYDNDSGKGDPRLWLQQGSDAMKLGCAVDPRSLGLQRCIAAAPCQQKHHLAVEASGGFPARPLELCQVHIAAAAVSP